jgi:hypothetical protein
MINAICCVLFLISLITFAIKTYEEREFNSVQYGSLELIGSGLFDTRRTKCTKFEYDDYVCCVSPGTAIVGWCPIIQFNHLCANIDDQHQPLQLCVYYDSNGIKLGNYVKCQTEICVEKKELYKMCLIYKFNNYTFYYCSPYDILANESINGNQPSQLKPGNYSAYVFVNNSIYYKANTLPIIIDVNIDQLLYNIHKIKLVSITFMIISVSIFFIGYLLKLYSRIKSNGFNFKQSNYGSINYDVCDL